MNEMNENETAEDVVVERFHIFLTEVENAISKYRDYKKKDSAKGIIKRLGFPADFMMEAFHQFWQTDFESEERMQLLNDTADDLVSRANYQNDYEMNQLFVEKLNLLKDNLKNDVNAKNFNIPIGRFLE